MSATDWVEENTKDGEINVQHMVDDGLVIIYETTLIALYDKVAQLETEVNLWKDI